MKPGDRAQLGHEESERFKGANVTIVGEYNAEAWLVRLEDTGQAPAYAMPDDRMVVRPKADVFELGV